jgi:uncharacterized membrane protein YfhO
VSIFLDAIGSMVILLGVTVMLPWDRWSTDVQVLLPLSCLGVIALLREAEGGTQAGISVLVLLPVCGSRCTGVAATWSP